jgi:predicted nuclease with TOPRIM domain
MSDTRTQSQTATKGNHMNKKKKPAATTLLKAANAEIADLKIQMEKLTKERDNERNGKDTFYQKASRLESEIEQVNMLLDVLPGAAPRKSEDEDRWRQKEYTLMTRLASYLASRHFQTAKHD